MKHIYTLLSICQLRKVQRRNLSKGVRVALLNAHSDTGHLAALLLKQNPLLLRLSLHGPGTDEQAKDLAAIDTKCRVMGHNCDIVSALRGVDVVTILSGTEPFKLDKLGKETADIAKKCAEQCPKAFLVVCARPVSFTLAVVRNAIQHYLPHWYHPARIIGSCSLAQARLDSEIAKLLHMDPSCVHVPCAGGPDTDTLVPIFSLFQPCNPFDQNLLDNFNENLDSCSETFASPEAFAINRLVYNLARGLQGAKDAVCFGCVRCSFIPDVKHTVCTIRIGKSGVEHNYGLPRMTKSELDMLEVKSSLVRERETLAENYA